MRVFQEMQRLVSEVDELRQRRARAEKALHAAESLRQVCIHTLMYMHTHT